MKAITLRNIEPDLQMLIERKAREEGTSLNKTVLRMLEEHLGLAVSPKSTRHRDLDHLAGTWAAEEADAFDRALTAQRAIDPEIWE